MLPRYLPYIGSRAWLNWLIGARRDVARDALRFLEMLGGNELPPHHQEFEALRSGLVHYFASLRRRTGGGTVVVSAQICRAVPLAIEQGGLFVRYVDIGPAYPTPEPAQFAAAMDAQTIAVVVAPLYGYIQPDWTPLIAALNGRSLVLDMAQGLGLAERTTALARCADAIGYSFGLGKGLDTGGGLLLTRRPLDCAELAHCGKAILAGSLLRAVTLHGLVYAGCYAPVMRRLDELDVEDQQLLPSVRRLGPDIYGLWGARLPKLLEEIARARAYAQILGRMPRITAALRYPDECFDPGSSHTRQLIRIGDATRRDALVARLRADGVDCAAAGERLPAVASSARSFPHAAAFVGDAIRLPFLGRLSDTQFDAFREKLEKAVVHCLH